jgi:serine phosphatase RsbU (regulator of sigma subunit)
MRWFDAHIMLPLRHRGMLLGIGLLGEQSRPLSLDENEGFFRSMRAFTTVALANVFLDSEAANKGTLRGKFDLATAMQEALMPEDRPIKRPGFELRGYYRAVEDCGGDLWSWRELADDRVLVVIADATGHGAAPALLAAAAKGAIDAEWQAHPDNVDPGHLLTTMNSAVHRVGRKRYMMTAFAAVLDKRAGKIRYANGGQNFPFFITGDKVELLVARGNQLGAAAHVEFEVHERELKVGDRVLLYTDGITEAGTPYMSAYGERRFRRAIAALANLPVSEIPSQLVARLDDYLGDVPVSDDVTLLVVQAGSREENSQ